MVIVWRTLWTQSINKGTRWPIGQSARAERETEKTIFRMYPAAEPIRETTMPPSCTANVSINTIFVYHWRYVADCATNGSWIGGFHRSWTMCTMSLVAGRHMITPLLHHDCNQHDHVMDALWITMGNDIHGSHIAWSIHYHDLQCLEQWGCQIVMHHRIDSVSREYVSHHISWVAPWVMDHCDCCIIKWHKHDVMRDVISDPRIAIMWSMQSMHHDFMISGPCDAICSTSWWCNPFYCDYIFSTPMYAMIYSGDDAIQMLWWLMGINRL